MISRGWSEGGGVIASPHVPRNKEVDDHLVEAFASLFKGRTDAHGQVNECVYEPVTLAHYEKHLRGEVNLGVYFLLDDSTCYFAAIDLDEKNFNKTKAIRDELVKNSIPAYITKSKSKGFHIYCFAVEKFKAVEIRRVLRHILTKLNIKAEVFPKQDHHQPDDPDGTRHPGSYINLPCFGYNRPFLSGNLEEVPLGVALQRIKRVPQEAMDNIIQTLPKEKSSKARPAQAKEYLGGKQPEKFSRVAMEKVLESCAFLQHCRDEAATLSEPHWWSMISVLAVFGEPGREKIHELSQPYPRYTEEETEQKIAEALKAVGKEIGPHTCIFIEQVLGFACPDDCLAKKWGLKSPVVLATNGLHITIDGTTYLERLDLNKIFSRYYPAKEDAPPVIKTLASFIIEPRMRINLDGEGERLDTVLKTSEAVYPCLFKREVWNSKRQFLAALPSVDLQYYGTDKDTQGILAMVSSEKLPIRKGTKVLGRNGDLWVLRDGVLSRDGWVDNPELVYIPSELDFDRRVHYPTIEDEVTFIRQVIPLLILLNEGKVIFPVLGWFFSTPFVPEIRRRLRHFPLLVVWGTHGGGKSSLLRLLWRLFGVESALFSSTETPFTFLRLFSGTNTIPIIIDEFKPFNMKEDETRLLIRFLKRLYDGEIEHRGRPDLSLIAYQLQAPTIVAGEVTPISLESAMVERVIQVNLNPDALTTNPDYTRAFNELAGWDLRAFAFPYIRWCLNVNLDDLMTEARVLLPATLQDIPSRVRDNVLVMATGLVALKRFAALCGVEIAQETFRISIEESVKGLLDELFERGAHEEIGLTIFLETLATLAQTGRVRYGVHYTTDDINTRLYIHLPDCLAEFRKFVRETNARVEVLDERAYRRQAREVCQRQGYILSTNCAKWFEFLKDEGGNSIGKTRRCIEIDMEKLPLDTSGFEKPGKE